MCKEKRQGEEIVKQKKRERVDVVRVGIAKSDMSMQNSEITLVNDEITISE